MNEFDAIDTFTSSLSKIFTYQFKLQDIEQMSQIIVYVMICNNNIIPHKLSTHISTVPSCSLSLPVRRMSPSSQSI